jgi:hypothetical protein
MTTPDHSHRLIANSQTWLSRKARL